MTTQELHNLKVHELAEKYKHQGYNVTERENTGLEASAGKGWHTVKVRSWLTKDSCFRKLRCYFPKQALYIPETPLKRRNIPPPLHIALQRTSEEFITLCGR
jgi:hypothetical protein